MRLLSFESNRVELGKFAYRYTVDRGNYFVVQEALTLPSSRQELNRFINNYRD